MEIAGGSLPEVKFGPENLHKRQLWRRFPATDGQGGKSVSKDKFAANKGERYRQELRNVGEKKGQDQQQGSSVSNDKSLKKPNEEMVESNLAAGGHAFIGETIMAKDKKEVQHVGYGGNKVHNKQKVWIPIRHKPNQVGHKNAKGRIQRSRLVIGNGPIQQVSLLKSTVDIPMNNPFSILNEQST